MYTFVAIYNNRWRSCHKTDKRNKKMTQRPWKEIRKFREIRFEQYQGIAKITINRARYRNAFTPLTTLELSQAFALCREMLDIRVVLLTGAMSPGARRQAPGGREARLLLGWRHAREGAWRLHRRRGRAPPVGARRADADTPTAQSPSSRWSTAMPSAAATCCTWCAT